MPTGNIQYLKTPSIIEVSFLHIKTEGDGEL